MSFTIKYAPKTLQEYVFPSNAARKKIERYLKGNDLRPLVLHGPSGVGKSCLASLLPSAMEGKKAKYDDIKGHELGEVSDIVKLFRGPPLFYKLFPIDGQKRQYMIINELNLSYKASLAMRTVIDDMQEDVQFIFTTNLIDQVDNAIRDRSCCLFIGGADANAWIDRADYIFRQEGIVVPRQDLLLMLQAQSQVSASNRALLDYLQTAVEDIRAKKEENGTLTPNTQTSPHVLRPYNPLGPAQVVA